MTSPRWLAAAAAGLCWAAAPAGLVGALLVACSGVFMAASVAGEPRGDLSRGWLIGTLAQLGALWWLPSAWEGFADSPGRALWLSLALWQGVPLGVGLALAGHLLSAECPRPLAVAVGTALASALGALTQIVPASASLWLIAVPGLGALVALGGAPLLDATWAALTAMLLDQPRAALRGSALVALLGTAWLSWPDGGETTRVALVQPGTGAFDGRRASTADARAEKLLRLVDEVRGADWLVTPEGAWPLDPGAGPGARRTTMLARWQGRLPTLLGVTVPDRRDRAPTNSVLVVEQGAVTGQVDKRALVPVAEQAWLGLGRDRYRAGSTGSVTTIAGVPVGVLICYEDLLPGAIIRAVWQGAEVLVAPANDAWLGHPRGAGLHLAGAQLAAVSSGRWLVRPTANGRSAIIDPAGRVRWSAPWIDGDRHPAAPGYLGLALVHRQKGRFSGGLLGYPLAWLAALGGLLWVRRRR